MSYVFVHIKAPGAKVEEALRLLDDEWDGHVTAAKTHQAEKWSTLALSTIAGAQVPALLATMLRQPIVAFSVTEQRLAITYWERDGNQRIGPIDGTDRSVIQEFGRKFHTDPGKIEELLQSSLAPPEQHRAIAKLLWLSVPDLADQPVDDPHHPSITPTNFEPAVRRYRRRQPWQRIYATLGILELVLVLGLMLAWSYLRVTPLTLTWLAVVIIIGVVLFLTRKTARSPKRARERDERPV